MKVSFLSPSLALLTEVDKVDQQPSIVNNGDVFKSIHQQKAFNIN